MSDPLGAILFPEERAAFLASPLRALPSIVSIVAACGVAALTLNRRIPLSTVLGAGLLFEVAASFGIAAAQYLDGSRWADGVPIRGLSWVAVWMLSFTVVMPSPPRRALAAALLSASSVPLVIGLVIVLGLAPSRVGSLQFFFWFVLPYLLVVLIAYVGAHIIYGLGTEIARARELGSYELVERLEHGGMGEVWRATHRLLARPAAIKLMRDELAGGSSPERLAELHARFEREAQVTASLRSPHTVELYDFGIADDGAFYYVMELLDGFNLGTLVDRFGPLPAGRVVHLLKQICHSLDEAHAAGLVHRDIKPANVYVCRYGREVDFVKVLDFGLVKQQQGRGAGPGVTALHAAGGTPAFMSPEQVLGDPPLDGRSDIYSVGCVGYWLLTGELVFTGRTALEAMMQHVQSPPAPPSARSELPVPPELDALLLDCLAKAREDRPRSAAALAARLSSIPLEAEWTPERALAWWDMHHPATAEGSMEPVAGSLQASGHPVR